MPTHDNSKRAYFAQYERLAGMQEGIYRYLVEHPEGKDDRQIRDALYPEAELNTVRARVSELKGAFWIEEIVGTFPRRTRAVSREDRDEKIRKQLEADREQAGLEIGPDAYEARLIKCIETLFPMALEHAKEYAAMKGAPPGHLAIRHRTILDASRDLLKEKGVII